MNFGNNPNPVESLSEIHNPLIAEEHLWIDWRKRAVLQLDRIYSDTLQTRNSSPVLLRQSSIRHERDYVFSAERVSIDSEMGIEICPFNWNRAKRTEVLTRINHTVEVRIDVSLSRIKNSISGFSRDLRPPSCCWVRYVN